MRVLAGRGSGEPGCSTGFRPWRCWHAIVGALFLATWTAGAHADSWIHAGDAGVRHDLQLLVDYGVLPHANVSSWPLPRAVLDELDQPRLTSAPAMVRDAWQRVSSRLSPGARDGQRLRTGAYAGGGEQIRPFHTTPRERGELEFEFWERRETLAWRLNVIAVESPGDDRKIRLDGSHLTARAGDWLLSAGALQRWWGPGHDGSLIFGNNARPVPGLSLQRAQHRPFATRGLSWFGPWDLALTLGRSGRYRSHPSWYLFGARATFRPLPGLELALVRTAQWGAGEHSGTWESFYDMLRGSEHRGENGEPQSHANQYAGYEFRYRILTPTPWAIYGQYVGRDSSLLLPRQAIGLVGLETWGGQPGAGVSYRLYLEYGDTLADSLQRRSGGGTPLHTPTYRHDDYPGGYRYFGRSLGHAIDSDSRMISTGLLFMRLDRDTLRARLWYADVNRTRRDLDTVGVSPGEISGLDLSWARQHGTWKLEIGTGLMRTRSPDREASWRPRGYLNVIRPL